jgi:hypothetical protein
LSQIFGGKLQVRRRDVLVQAMDLRRARDGNDPGLLRQQPGERYLSGRGLLLPGDLVEQVDEGLIRLQGIRRSPTM